MTGRPPSASKPEARWPPKSPHEALLSSPSGRRKYEQRRERNSVSPSPIKRPTSTSRLNFRDKMASEEDEDEDEDEDEETLQLKLKAIEARLKLKKLQNKSKHGESSHQDDDGLLEHSRPGTAASLRPGKRRRAITPPPPEIQVPVSPNENRALPQEQRSPARVLLGIDKGIRARDVSLKRASSTNGRDSSLRQGRGVHLSRSNSRAGSQNAGSSFSDRIAASRLGDREKKEKEERISQSRSKGFGLDRGDTSKPDPSQTQRGVASPFVTTANSQDSGLRRNQSLSSLGRWPSRAGSTSRELSGNSSISTGGQSQSQAVQTRPTSTKDYEDEGATDGPSFESFSGIHLSTRKIPHNVLTRTLDGKETYSIPRLISEIKGPDYEPPDVESDYVVFGIIASKSTPREHKNNLKTMTTGDPDDLPQRAKYMALHLVDLKYEIDLFLFDTAFNAFWKLPVGTLVAILNPGVMPPRVRDSGAFALKLASSEDSVLEIGMARDLGFCKSIKKDGQQCTSWVNKRKTEYCEFHISLVVEKSKSGRMEVNTMAGWKSKGSKGMYDGRGGKAKDSGLRPEGPQYDKFLHETTYVIPKEYSRNPGAASLLDRDADPNAFDRGCSREELFRRRQADAEKERELAKKLGSMGNGTGSEYLRRSTKEASKISSLPSQEMAPTSTQEARDAASLGLLGKRASDVRLSPTKRKRSQQLGGTAEPMGWGGARKRGLLIKSPTKAADRQPVDKEGSPVKKRARFMLDKKGIREPGRESLGNVQADFDDDDDDLDIV